MSYQDKTKEEIILDNILEKIESLSRSILDLRNEIKQDYVTRRDLESAVSNIDLKYNPTKKRVEHILTIIIGSIVTAVMYLILKQ